VANPAAPTRFPRRCRAVAAAAAVLAFVTGATATEIAGGALAAAAHTQAAARKPLVLVFPATSPAAADSKAPAPSPLSSGDAAPAAAAPPPDPAAGGGGVPATDLAARAVRERLGESGAVDAVVYVPDAPTFVRTIRENKLELAQVENPTPQDRLLLETAAAHTANAAGEVAVNRQRLVRAMAAAGFANLPEEWWHFSYDVPDPVRFDLIIR